MKSASAVEVNRCVDYEFRWEQGYVILPTEPGLGVELNEDVALAHPYTGDKLHLEMTNVPVLS